MSDTQTVSVSVAQVPGDVVRETVSVYIDETGDGVRNADAGFMCDTNHA